ncbi:MAG: acetoin utilization protein AcuC [Nitrososphaerota archaeon]|nr:acetoin utilization protein AcuC [Nitrososphaerales archaeon]MDW8044149.1 acetoin utilization protein AcuC [Nitrososphaerota archaeon]
MCKVGVFYGEKLAEYSFPKGHPLNRRRVELFWESMVKQGLTRIDGIKICEPIKASRDDLLSFHTEEYVRFVEDASRSGHGYLDYGDTPAFKGIYEASCFVVGSALKALEIVMNKEVDHSFIPIGGLHHARRDRAAGFCVFNDVAVTIVKAKKVYGLKRILYVDIDAHHGDGVFYEFYDDPSVYIMDIHEDGRYLYPGTGFPHETGSKDATGTKLNLPLNPGSGDEEFKAAFDSIDEFILKAEPEIILFQCGADGLKEDPLTHLNYTVEAHRYATRKLHLLSHNLCDGRLIAFGGGGYRAEKTAEAWIEVVKSLYLKPESTRL